MAAVEEVAMIAEEVTRLSIGGTDSEEVTLRDRALEAGTPISYRISDLGEVGEDEGEGSG